MHITSLHNPRVKAAARLRDRRGREEQQRIIIDGFREISRAVESGIELIELYYLADTTRGEDLERLLNAATSSGAELHEVAPPVMEKLSFGERLEGVVAVAKKPVRTLKELDRAAGGLLAVVEGAEKPGNIGAILRTADAAGLCAVIVADGGTDLYNPNTIRASLGAIFTTPVCETTSEAALRWLKKRGYRVFAARVDGAIDYTAGDYRGNVAIVLGSEAHGLGERWRGDDITAIRLPMRGAVDSLNLSATAAVLFYEALRQRSAKTPMA